MTVKDDHISSFKHKPDVQCMIDLLFLAESMYEKEVWAIQGMLLLSCVHKCCISVILFSVPFCHFVTVCRMQNYKV